MRPRKAAWKRAAVVLLLMVAALTTLAVRLNAHGEGSEERPSSERVGAGPQTIERGAYLARAGNCAACHTERGGEPYAGGRGIDTPFGIVYASNLTPDTKTGIGAWSSTDFWGALHNGRSRDGRLLYPAFPYPSYTQITREDADAIYAFLRSLSPVERANRPHALRFPYGSQVSVSVWRALFFSPEEFVPDAHQSAEWNRGAYLVRGLGHCAACHAPRNTLGATTGGPELGGGLIPMQNWYAPSLAKGEQGGVADWSTEDIVELLRTGKAARGSAMGPMAGVVSRSTQHLSDTDLRSIAVYLQQLPGSDSQPQRPVKPEAALLARGGRIYKDSCAQCHGEQGQGSGASYPPLMGNLAATMASPANVIRAVIDGGYLPTTSGNPRPFGMPPFGQALSNADIAAVATYVRHSWGNEASAVSELDVLRTR